MKRKDYGIHKKVIALLLVLLLLIIPLYYLNAWQFNRGIHTAFAKQELSFPYYLKPGGSGYVMYLGDLNGLNKITYVNLLKLTEKDMPASPSMIVVPSLLPAKSMSVPEEITSEDFYEHISNRNGVVLADNFCTKSWEALGEKSLYETTSLSPGPFCQSEEEARDLNAIIRTYPIRKILIVYDVESYKEFIHNFIQYLEEQGMPYEFVQARDLE